MTKDTGNGRIRIEQKTPENLSSQFRKPKKLEHFQILYFFVARIRFRGKNPDMVADNRELSVISDHVRISSESGTKKTPNLKML